MKTIVIEDICVGCAMCVQICPEVFEIRDDKVVVMANPIPKELEDKVKRAASECPVEAIKIE